MTDTWRLAHTLEHLREQVNAKWPNRSKDSDGSIGDARHQAESSSDHNPHIPDPPGPHVVSAIDITHDPAHGFNSYSFADELLAKQDHRLKYVISNRRIGSGPAGPSAGIWRPYHGVNPHDHHVHISVMAQKVLYDDTKDWSVDGVPSHSTPLPPPTIMVHAVPSPNSPPFVRPGSSGVDVQRMQTLLGCKVTGEYIAGSETEWALRLFQARHGLISDGACGAQSWAALLATTTT